MTHKLKLADHVSLTEVDGQAVLVDLASGTYFGVNHVGLDFLNQIQTGASLQDAITEVSKLYAMKIDDVEQDIMRLVNDMLNQSLLIKTH